jgi:hypothetical protein
VDKVISKDGTPITFDRMAGHVFRLAPAEPRTKELAFSR